MRNRLFLLTLVALYATGAASAQCGSRNANYYVAAVILQDHGTLTAQETAAAKLAVIGNCFDPAKREELRRQVRRTLRECGYWKAEVQAPVFKSLDEAPSLRPASLTFDVTEGQRYVIEQVVWSGEKAFTDVQLDTINVARPGEVLRVSDVAKTIAGITRLYVARGFPNAVVIPEIQTATDRATVTFDILESGQQLPADASPESLQ